MRNSLIELFFPRFCLGCGYLGAYVCQSCVSKMTKIKKIRCFYCDKPSFLGLTHPKCRKDGGVDGFYSIYSYGGLFKKLLQESKYKGAVGVLQTLLTTTNSLQRRDLQQWVKVFNPQTESVPLHPQRERQRGYNQSEIIKRWMFYDMEFPHQKLLERTINTAHLANMNSKTMRRKHIKNSFRFIGPYIPKSVLLIDDVITSGSTILECSKTLKESGVETVLAFSLAKG